MNFSTILFNNNLLARRHVLSSQCRNPGRWNESSVYLLSYRISYSRIFFFFLPLFLRPFLRIYIYTHDKNLFPNVILSEILFITCFIRRISPNHERGYIHLSIINSCPYVQDKNVEKSRFPARSAFQADALPFSRGFSAAIYYTCITTTQCVSTLAVVFYILLFSLFLFQSMRTTFPLHDHRHSQTLIALFQSGSI